MDFLHFGFLIGVLLVASIVRWDNQRAGHFFGIVDYRPSSFSEQPEHKFFFSVGTRLMFGSVTNDSFPALFDGYLSAVYPSPDQTKAAVVSGDNLYLVEVGKATTLISKGMAATLGQGTWADDTFFQPTLAPSISCGAVSKRNWI